MKALYHGTTEEFDIIDTSRGKGYKDFGRGITVFNGNNDI